MPTLNYGNDFDLAKKAYHEAVEKSRGQPDADITDLQDTVIRYGNGFHMYMFANEVDGADVKKIQAAFIAKNCTEYVHDMARVPGADVNALQDLVLNSGTGWHMYMFAHHVFGADTAALQRGVMEKGDMYDIYRFAKDIKDADIAALQGVVLTRGTPYDIVRFASEIECSDVHASRAKLVEMRDGGLDASNRLDVFDNDFDIIRKLKAESKKHRPS